MLYNASLASDRRDTNKVGQVYELPDARGSAHGAVVQVQVCKIEVCQELQKHGQKFTAHGLSRTNRISLITEIPSKFLFNLTIMECYIFFAKNGDLAPVLLQRELTSEYKSIAEWYSLNSILRKNMAKPDTVKKCLLNDVMVIFWLIPRPYIKD